MSKQQAYEEYFGEDEIKSLKDDESNDTEATSKKDKKQHGRGSCASNSDWEGSQNAPWIVGLVFILLGGGLLASNVLGFSFNNWWALFFLIPIGGSLSSAMYQYQKKGRLNEEAIGALFAAMLLSFIMSIFLFGLSWTLFFPAILIMIGVKMLLQARTETS